jgi:shikimate dehydrogenase
MKHISSSTQLLGIIGHPIGHTLSPPMHNKALSLLELDYLYVVFHVLPQDLEKAVLALPALKIKGINVTIPYKQDVLQYLDEVSPCAKRIGAVNTILVKNGRLYGFNTDGEGFINSLTEAGFNPAGKKIILLGAGGACRAVALSLAWSGAKKLIIAARKVTKAEDLARETKLEQEIEVECLPLVALPEKKVADADLIVNTTPLGMTPYEDQMPYDSFYTLHSGQYICDLIYNPLETQFLKSAKLKGCKTINGVGMLVHQGAKSFSLWTGKTAPVEEMRQIVMEHVDKTR